jgi:hypothetical protein
MTLVAIPLAEHQPDRRERTIWCAVIYQSIRDKRAGCKRAAYGSINSMDSLQDCAKPWV